MKALVTGASGFIGATLVDRLLVEGDAVVALTRRADRSLPAGARRCVGNLATGAGITSNLLDGVDVVFNCAGELRDPGAMRALHVDGTRRLVDLAAQHGTPLRWVQLSSVGAYGPPRRIGEERTVVEATPEQPRGPYETTKTDSDRLVRDLAVPPITWTILRPSNVIGTRMPNPAIRGMVAMLRRRLFFYIGRPGAVATYVHVDDVASALMTCARHPAAAGQTYNLSSDCALEALIEQLCLALGVPPPSIRLPEGLVRSATAALGLVVRLPLTASRIDALVNRTRYPSGRIASSLDFRFSRPMPAAATELIGG